MHSNAFKLTKTSPILKLQSFLFSVSCIFVLKVSLLSTTNFLVHVIFILVLMGANDSREFTSQKALQLPHSNLID